jgi:flavin reductase (DIM6/NTAB) family NADH-FMN oxidoreductase RutF
MSGFEKVFRKIFNGVFVITTKKGDIVNGMTAAWVSRASFKPPLLSVSIGKTRYSHDLIKDSGEHFGFKSGRKTDKFEGIEYETRKTGSPILQNTAGYFDCNVVKTCDAGDHTIFTGEVVDAEVYEDNVPLLFKHEDFF